MIDVMKISVAAIALVATHASASTPAAWNSMNKRVNRTCMAASQLARPQMLAKIISFSDDIGVEIRQIRGVDRRGRVNRRLCAYNRATGRAEVQDAENWNGRTIRY